MSTPKIDLHLHSTASDGEYSPAEVVRRAAAAGISIIALTDHDTLAGVQEAVETGHRVGVRVIAGCEFSVDGPGGEMHLLGYFLPDGEPILASYLEDQRRNRLSRLDEIVRRLRNRGVHIDSAEVVESARGGAVGRPHIARVLTLHGFATDVPDAFQRYIGFGRPAFAPRLLPRVETVTGLVRSVGGLTSAAHLKERATNTVLNQLRKWGVDCVEIKHPGHGQRIVHRLTELAERTGFLLTGGSDWHGEHERKRDYAPLGAITIPEAWLRRLEAAHVDRWKAVQSC